MRPPVGEYRVEQFEEPLRERLAALRGDPGVGTIPGITAVSPAAEIA